MSLSYSDLDGIGKKTSNREKQNILFLTYMLLNKKYLWTLWSPISWSNPDLGKPHSRNEQQIQELCIPIKISASSFTASQKSIPQKSPTSWQDLYTYKHLSLNVAQDYASSQLVVSLLKSQYSNCLGKNRPLRTSRSYQKGERERQNLVP